MSVDDEVLRQSPLHEVHQREGGRLVSFAGWEMPVQYRGINDEHMAVREAVGLFDVSHMGQFSVRGAGALVFLQYILPAEPSRLDIGGMLYSVMCNERGGCVDDLLLYRMGEQQYLVVVNAARAAVDWQWMQDAASGFGDFELADTSADTAMLALQGPLAVKVLSQVAGQEVDSLDYYHCKICQIGGAEVLLSRNGYTGEDGFELMCATADAEPLWNALRQAGARPCGLGARDTLRTEMGFSLYGHELGEDITPLEARLAWALSLGKAGDFIGKEALLQQERGKKYRRLRGFKMLDKGIPRQGYEVLNEGDEVIGVVSSGTHSPCLQRGIGLAFLEPGSAQLGGVIHIAVRGRRLRAEVVKLPFVPSHVKNNSTAKN